MYKNDKFPNIFSNYPSSRHHFPHFYANSSITRDKYTNNSFNSKYNFYNYKNRQYNQTLNQCDYPITHCKFQFTRLVRTKKDRLPEIPILVRDVPVKSRLSA